jgi:hypothetical protein
VDSLFANDLFYACRDNVFARALDVETAHRVT